MSTFYKKIGEEYIPVEFKDIETNWDNKLVIAKIEDKKYFDEIWSALNDVTIINNVETSILVTDMNISFEVLDDIKDKYIMVKVGNKDMNFKYLSKLKEMLNDIDYNFVIAPSSLTLKEYNELIELKRRLIYSKKRTINK